MLLNYYYDKYVIKKWNISDSYFEIQNKNAIERGMTFMIYSNEKKEEERNKIILSQKQSLKAWIDYLFISMGNKYPMWFKYFVFQGVIRIGKYDQKLGFSRRNKSTISPFVEINKCAIELIYNVFDNYFIKQTNYDKKLLNLVENGGFVKLYEYCISRLSVDSNFNDTKGIWKRYYKGSNPSILFNDIHGKGTGWCTALSIETASLHLRNGDFYVYFTKDINNAYTRPRIAIRTSFNKLVEVRGIGSGQNIESHLQDIVNDKLKEFSDIKEYEKKVIDMRYLTEIYEKYESGIELNNKDLIFIYEIERPIIGFGFGKDPRIEKIISSRNIKKDLSYVFSCDENQIALTQKEALSGNNIVYYYGNLDLNEYSNKDIKNIVFPKFVSGRIMMNCVTKLSNITLPNVIGGSLIMKNVCEIENVLFSSIIGGTLALPNLYKSSNVIFPELIRGSLFLNSLNIIDNSFSPKKVLGFVRIGNSENSSIECFEDANKFLRLSKQIKHGK